MRFEEVLPALRDGAAIQRSGQPIKWAYLMKSPNGAFHWYGYHDDQSRATPMNIDHEDLLAEDWVVVDEAAVRALKPEATFNCPRRREQGMLNPDDPAHLFDHWREHAHLAPGARSCSYCGSVHPDDFMQAVRAGVEVGPTDKNYKAYMTGPGFDHAKFYYQHLSVEQRGKFVQMINDKTMKIGEPGYFYTLPFFAVPAEDAKDSAPS